MNILAFFFPVSLFASIAAHAAAQTYTISAEPYEITVTVTALAPNAVISASPDSGIEPLDSTISWSSVNATRVSVTLDGSTISTASSGSYAANGLRAGTHTAEISVSGPGGSVTDTASFTVLAGVDPDVQIYVAATGATNITGINNLVKAIKARNRWNNFAALLFKSSENYSAGTSVKGLGPLAGDATLVNGPAITALGATFDGINDYGTWSVSDFHSWTQLTRISRSAPGLASRADVSRSSVEHMGNSSIGKMWFVGSYTSYTSGETITSGFNSISVNNRRGGTSDAAWSEGEDHCMAFISPNGSNPVFWKNTTVLSTNKVNGVASQGIVPANSGWTNNDILTLSAENHSTVGDALWVNERRIALIYFNVALPDAEVIEYVDLINAL